MNNFGIATVGGLQEVECPSCQRQLFLLRNEQDTRKIPLRIANLERHLHLTHANPHAYVTLRE